MTPHLDHELVQIRLSLQHLARRSATGPFTPFVVFGSPVVNVG